MSRVLRRDILRIGILAVLGFTGLSRGASTRFVPNTGKDSRDDKDVGLDVMAIRATCQGLVPIPGLVNSVYDAIVAQWQRAASTDTTLGETLRQVAVSVRQRFGNEIPGADSAEFASFLATVEHTAFGAELLSALTLATVTRPEVWEIAGYEGESFTRGGYLLRGFNDLDWLPEPPSTAMGPLP